MCSFAQNAFRHLLSKYTVQITSHYSFPLPTFTHMLTLSTIFFFFLTPTNFTAQLLAHHYFRIHIHVLYTYTYGEFYCNNFLLLQPPSLSLITMKKKKSFFLFSMWLITNNWDCSAYSSTELHLCCGCIKWTLLNMP